MEYALAVMEWRYDEKYVLLLTRQKGLPSYLSLLQGQRRTLLFFGVRGWALLLYKFLEKIFWFYEIFSAFLI